MRGGPGKKRPNTRQAFRRELRFGGVDEDQVTVTIRKNGVVQIYRTNYAGEVTRINLYVFEREMREGKQIEETIAELRRLLAKAAP